MAKRTIYLIIGAMAVGKSTVARRLASRFERGVHFEGDVFRRGIVSGRREMTPGPPPEELEQLPLRCWLAAAAAGDYLEAGFSVALEDVGAPAFSAMSAVRSADMSEMDMGMSEMDMDAVPRPPT